MKENLLKKSKFTSGGYEIYYDKASGEAVGIVWDIFVFLKNVSDECMSQSEAEKYCKTIYVNGHQAALFEPEECLGAVWCMWPQIDVKKIGFALQEIGAENLDAFCWCASYPYDCKAWLVNFASGEVYLGFIGENYFARGVLYLDHRFAQES